MNNNDFSLLLNRISLAITLLYLGFLFIIVSPSDPIARDGAGMLLAFLFPHLIALALAAIFNIIISLEGSINQMLIGITLIFYIIAGFLGTIMVLAVSVQVTLLSISIYRFK